MDEYADGRECRWTSMPMDENADGRECRWTRMPMDENADGRECRWTWMPTDVDANGLECRWTIQQTLPKPLTSSVSKELETKAAPRLTANEKLLNPHSGVHKALPERSTKLTTEDPNVQLNSVRGILNTPAYTGPTASATSASNKRGETTNNEEDCQSTAEVLRTIIGDAIVEEERVIILLSSLPDRFSTLVTALEAHEKIPAWEVVTERLLNEERRQRGGPGTSDSNEKLMRGTKGYRLYDFNNKMILLSRDVVFNESQFMSFEKDPSKEIECVPWSFAEEEKHENSEGELELRRSTRNRAAPDRFGGGVAFCTMEIDLMYCPSNDMLADIFTKGVSAEKFSRLRRKLGVVFVEKHIQCEKEC
ncbi:hypothetical protein FHG87_018423 [Trinorchestia longiramus]|nr:hypothetical protein FHG87_018423 [Trinorchestia longiramus]